MTAAERLAGSARAERLTPAASLSGIGSMLKYRAQPLARFEAARALSDRAVAFSVLGLPYIAFFDLKAIEHILVTRHADFEKDAFTHDLRRVLGTGLLTSEGDAWRRQRKLIAPSFQPREIGAYGPVMVERAHAFAQGQAPAAVFDIHSAMMHLTLDILVRALFGTRVSRGAEVERLLDQLMVDYMPAAAAWRLILPEWLPLPSRRRLASIRAELDVILLELIRDRKARAAAEANDAATTLPADLLGRLMLAHDTAGTLSEEAVRDEAMTLFLAGHETTALSLTYTLRLLAQHPAEADALFRELEHVLRGRPPSMSDLPALPYTRAVIDEALRLYPPAWAIGRQPIEDTVVAGVVVPQGTMLIIAPWVMHRDARFFPDPERFWPERWLSGPAAPRYAYLPFGAGPRVCVGSHFALSEAALILITLVQHARFELEPNVGGEPPELELRAAITLRPRGPVSMRMLPR